MTVITTGNFPKALRPGVKKWWGRAYDEHPVEYTVLFDEDTSDKSYEELVEATGFGLAPTKTEGAATTYDTESQGTLTRSTHVAYGLGFIITREEMDDNLYMEVGKQRSRALAFSFRQTKEVVAANIYNRAFNSSYTFGDGKELLATDHPTLNGTQSNELSTSADLSEASLEDLSIQVSKAKNSRGLRIALRKRCLIVPPDLEFEANRIYNSVLQNDTANNAINALRATGAFPEGIKVNHYLTDSDAFFIRTALPSGTGLVCFNRVPISFDDDNDFDTKNAKFKGYERYSFTAGDFRALYGSPGV